MFHDRHHVSVKIAIFSADLQRVLLMHYPKRDVYGLPGGHIDKGESPDFALARELKEELGITVENPVRKDFFLSSRLILAYTAIVPNDFETFPTDPKFEYAVWHTRDELDALENLSDDYMKFVKEYWPSA